MLQCCVCLRTVPLLGFKEALKDGRDYIWLVVVEEGTADTAAGSAPNLVRNEVCFNGHAS
jgi:hypothetical protein